MAGAELARISRLMRKPYFRFWRLVERRAYRGRAYTLHVPSGKRVLTPWYDAGSDPDFARDLAAARAAGPMALSADRCYLLYRLCQTALSGGGSVAECGVFTGGSAHLLCRLLDRRRPAPSLHLFDTFEGMPAVAVARRDYHRPGDFSGTSLGAVRARLAAYPFCEFHAGVMPGTFAQVDAVSPYAFVHVDVDIYPSILACCEWFWPRMRGGGVMLIDDYGFYPYRYAARAAVDDFFRDRDGVPIALPTGQALVLKPQR
jgi:hypothetical protein